MVFLKFVQQQISIFTPIGLFNERNTLNMVTQQSSEI
jgi:hypothetical protein